jgi:hypothetical protein
MRFHVQLDYIIYSLFSLGFSRYNKVKVHGVIIRIRYTFDINNLNTFRIFLLQSTTLSGFFILTNDIKFILAFLILYILFKLFEA